MAVPVGSIEIHTFTKDLLLPNEYKLTFKLKLSGTSAFIFGHDPTYHEEYAVQGEYFDGIYIFNNRIVKYSYDTLQDTQYLNTMIGGKDDDPTLITIIRENNTFNFYINDNLTYTTTDLQYNTVGAYDSVPVSGATYISATDFDVEQLGDSDITPSVDDYDGAIFGSNWHLELRDDHLNFTDYGMLPQGATGGALVLATNVPLPKGEELGMEITTTYNNKRFERLNTLYGEIQARVFEDISTNSSDNDYYVDTIEYDKVLCSPSPIPNAKTIFTRHSEEGTLYFVKPNYLIDDEKGKVMQRPQYMTNAYSQYKGGVQCYTETGISLFSLDNGYSPIYVGNNLVRAEFHRRSGYVVLSRYDENTDSWYSANILKLSDNLKLSLGEYNDDYARINFGATTWEFYRGRPFIVVKHPNTDIRILKLVDRVYCETMSNEQGMGFIEEHNTLMSTFDPQTTIQRFKQELHIGENIRTDNFDLYEVDSDGNLTELEHTATLSTQQWENQTALVVNKGWTGKLALNFPSSSRYVKKPSDTFSLYIGKIDVDSQTSITIKARGFDENGEIPLIDGIQYGIWEQSQTFTVNSNTDDIRATFTCNNKEVEYIDFVVIFNTASTSTIKMTQLMCHDGDSEPNWDVDTSIINANHTNVYFDETYYANLYFADAPVGLCIIRPYQDPFSLKTLKASKETVLAPYMKKSKEWDKPSNVFLEYLNVNRQTIDIDWEEF